MQKNIAFPRGRWHTIAARRAKLVNDVRARGGVKWKFSAEENERERRPLSLSPADCNDEESG